MFYNLDIFIHRIQFTLILIPSTIIKIIFSLDFISHYLSFLKNFKYFFLIANILNLKLIMFKNDWYLYENQLNLNSKHLKKS